MSGLFIPTLQDVLRAKRRLESYLTRTQLSVYPALNELTGCKLFVKHENQMPTGSFKVRGGINVISQLSDSEKRQGIISASTGNHGQSIAYAAKLFGVKAKIAAPEGANPIKVASMRAMGTEVILHGKDFDEARMYAVELSQKQGCRYIHTANEPLIIAGVGTFALEILEDEPDIEVIIVPVGGGSGASGCCVVAKAVNPNIEVIAVQAEGAPAAYLSWKSGQPTEAKMETFAEGLATRVPFELTQKILRKYLDDFVLVSDDEMRAAMRLYLEKTRNIVEAAGAATLAAALKIKTHLQGRRVGIVVSGGNVSMEQLKSIITSD
ncbi:threonine/serine dehydratase [Candidatus Acetothermia bacterium]|nr:threonine/serine dehydratase [Candidatus Acetothermia bacterium]MBI3643762.1 threonine/serine dehydratase [Candidatus Acetothermia bacterium]